MTENSKPPTTVAMCAVLRNERRYILEWIAHHRRLGVTRFQLYDNESDDGAGPLLAALQARVGVTVTPWPGRGLQRQLDAFLAGAQALSFQSDFVAFLDLDEFLVTDGGESLARVLARTPADVGAVAVNQRIFGSAGRARFEPDLVTARFTMCADDSRDEHRWVKIVARPEFVRHFTSPHSVALSFGRQVMTDGRPLVATAHAGEADRVSSGGIRINHYMLKSREEFDAKQRRGAFFDAAETFRLDDTYFTARDPGCNAVREVQAADAAADLREDIRRMVEDFPPELRRIVHDDLGL